LAVLRQHAFEIRESEKALGLSHKSKTLSRAMKDGLLPEFGEKWSAMSDQSAKKSQTGLRNGSTTICLAHTTKRCLRRYDESRWRSPQAPNVPCAWRSSSRYFPDKSLGLPERLRRPPRALPPDGQQSPIGPQELGIGGLMLIAPCRLSAFSRSRARRGSISGASPSRGRNLESYDADKAATAPTTNR
jgi:hypothetical protein